MPTIKVAYGVRRVVNLYTKLLVARYLAYNNNLPNKEATLLNIY
jgi:hypothetical protein